MASNILGKISKERTISAVVIVIAALAAILPGGIILAAVLYGVSVIGYLELTKACGVRQKTQEGMDDKRLNALGSRRSQDIMPRSMSRIREQVF